jgi:16S rRNA (adenine1518-N6/adenine1519-N6)-dimethyltransferase
MGACYRLVKCNDPAFKKRFGQHFLRDTGVIGRIVRWIQPTSNDFVLDIGAGDGALSTHLAPGVARLIAIEVDRDCIPRLEKALAPFESATVIEADILQLNLVELVSRYLQPGQRLRIAGNLPYNIATAIIEKLLHIKLPIEQMFFTVQLEVAQRITAQPGSRQYGFLSVYCQHRAFVQMGFKISPACFIPKPKVSSAMVSFRPKAYPPDSNVELDFEALCKAAFGYRRKTLQNSLRRHPQFGGFADALLRRAGIDGSRRAEDLSVRDYEFLASVLCSLKSTASHAHDATP